MIQELAHLADMTKLQASEVGVLEGLGLEYILIIVVYFVIVASVGIYAYTKTKDEEGFLVAGREIGPIVGAATLSATQMSAGTFIGTFAVHYLTGIGFMWIWTGLWLGWVISLVGIAPYLREFGEMTVPDFLAVRYGDDGADGNRTRAVSAIVIVAAYSVYLTAQFTGGSLVLQSLFGVSLNVGIVILVGVALFYTAAGGMRASMLTDFIQAVVMAVGIFISIPVIIHFCGGPDYIFQLFSSYSPDHIGMFYTPLEIGGFMAAFGFSMAAAPYEMARVYSMRDVHTVRLAIGFTIIFQIIIGSSVAIAGLGMKMLFPALTTPDLASVIMSINVLSPVLGALVISAVLSALLSTVDSIMVVSASGLAHDLYAKIINPDASEEKKLWVNRGSVVLLSIIPALLTQAGDLLGGLVQFIVILQASMMGSMFFMPLLLGLHWKKVNTAGGVGGVLSGLTTVMIWHFGRQFDVITGTAAELDPVVPGVIVSLAVLVTLSFLGRKPSKRALIRFFEVEEGDYREEE